MGHPGVACGAAAVLAAATPRPLPPFVGRAVPPLYRSMHPDARMTCMRARKAYMPSEHRMHARAHTAQHAATPLRDERTAAAAPHRHVHMLREPTGGHLALASHANAWNGTCQSHQMTCNAAIGWRRLVRVAAGNPWGARAPVQGRSCPTVRRRGHRRGADRSVLRGGHLAVLHAEDVAWRPQRTSNHTGPAVACLPPPLGVCGALCALWGAGGTTRSSFTCSCCK